MRLLTQARKEETKILSAKNRTLIFIKFRLLSPKGNNDLHINCSTFIENHNLLQNQYGVICICSTFNELDATKLSKSMRGDNNLTNKIQRQQQSLHPKTLGSANLTKLNASPNSEKQITPNSKHL